MSGFCQSYILEFSEIQITFSLHGSLIKSPHLHTKTSKKYFLSLSSLLLAVMGLSMEGRLCCNSTAHRCRDLTQIRVRVSTQCLEAQQDHGVNQCTDRQQTPGPEQPSLTLQSPFMRKYMHNSSCFLSQAFRNQ